MKSFLVLKRRSSLRKVVSMRRGTFAKMHAAPVTFRGLFGDCLEDVQRCPIHRGLKFIAIDPPRAHW